MSRWKCVYFLQDLKDSLTQDFWGKLTNEKNLTLKILCQTSFKGCKF
jgi:hypothetical protein